jgi:tetratricopeptide (TPR) repeat protein
LFTAGSDRTVKSWDATNRAFSAGNQRGARSVAFGPDGSLAAAETTFDTPARRTIIVWDAAGQKRHSILMQGQFCSLAFRPDGRQLAVHERLPGREGASTPDEARLWVVETASGASRELAQTHLVGQGLHGLAQAWSPDGQRIATLAAELDQTKERIVRNLIVIRDAETGKVVRQIETGFGVREIVFRPGARQLAVLIQRTNVDGQLTVFDSDSGERVWMTELGRTIQSATGGLLINGLAYDWQGGRLAVRDAAAHAENAPNVVRVLEANTGRDLLRLQGLAGSVRSVAFSPDSRRVLAADEKDLQLWDAATGQGLLSLRITQPTLRDTILAASFSPDGRRVLAWRNDAEVPADQPALTVCDATPVARDIEVREQAEALVSSLSSTTALKAELIEQLSARTDLTDEARRTAVKIAGDLDEEGGALNGAAWEIAKLPSQSADDYRRALRYAEAAVALQSENGNLVNTLGVAQYRAGRYEEALANLERSLALNADPTKGPHPIDLVFLAMTSHRLGRDGAARDYLEKFRQRIRGAALRNAPNDELRDFSKEAEELIAPGEVR